MNINKEQLEALEKIIDYVYEIQKKDYQKDIYNSLIILNQFLMEIEKAEKQKIDDEMDDEMIEEFNCIDCRLEMVEENILRLRKELYDKDIKVWLE